MVRNKISGKCTAPTLTLWALKPSGCRSRYWQRSVCWQNKTLFKRKSNIKRTRCMKGGGVSENKPPIYACCTNEGQMNLVTTNTPPYTLLLNHNQENWNEFQWSKIWQTFASDLVSYKKPFTQVLLPQFRSYSFISIMFYSWYFKLTSYVFWKQIFPTELWYSFCQLSNVVYWASYTWVLEAMRTTVCIS